MRTHTFAIILAFLLLTFTLAGCGGSSGGGGAGNELDMGGSSFLEPHGEVVEPHADGVSLCTLADQVGALLSREQVPGISAGQALHMVDAQDTGGTHTLCLGENGTCDTSASGPAELKGPGMSFSPGTTKDVTFSTAGTYHITCTIHPSMNVTINVQ